jgi:hypothetical protein
MRKCRESLPKIVRYVLGRQLGDRAARDLSLDHTPEAKIANRCTNAKSLPTWPHKKRPMPMCRAGSRQ